MGKAKYFFALTYLLLIGWAPFSKGWHQVGIDFEVAQTWMYVLPKRPTSNNCGTACVPRLGNSEIQAISDIANPNSNEF